MKKNWAIVITILLILPFLATLTPRLYAAQKRATLWDFQSIDTMKYSRDLSREKINDSSFDQTINQQVENIAKTGATHIAIATPYDEEFLPILKRWVKTARKYSLKVWFRGNWSGWEKWFNYPPIDRQTHLAKTQKFILDNRDLFEDGDIFSACPECENGGPGDPRHNKDARGHRKFLIDEYKITKDAFKKIGKNVQSNYNSMNGDVARLIMDKETTESLDGIVVIDHYVATPEQMVSDIKQIAEASGGKVVLGEFGAPISGIHGKMTEEEQAIWIRETLWNLITLPELAGVNYWVSTGGSTEIWRENGQAKKAIEVITTIYQPLQIIGSVRNELEDPIENATIEGRERKTTTDASGRFVLPYLEENQTLKISAEGHQNKDILISQQIGALNITLGKKQNDLIFKIRRFLKGFLGFL